MKKLSWFIAGIAIGSIVARQLEENPKAQELVKDAKERAKDFGAAISEGFRERESEIVAETSPKKAPPAKRASSKPASSKPAKSSAE